MNINKEYKIDIKNKILKYYDCDIIIDDNEPYFYINANDLARILNIKNIISFKFFCIEVIILIFTVFHNSFN